MIHPTAIIADNVTLGKNVSIGAYTTIGFAPEHKSFKDKSRGVIIGDNVIIRECVTIHAGMEDITSIGNNCFIMSHSHIGHDSQLGNDVVISAGATLAGHVTVGQYAYVGINACLHQYAALPQLSILGAGSFFKGLDFPPGRMLVGSPAKAIGLNKKGIIRNLPLEEATAMIRQYQKGKI